MVLSREDIETYLENQSLRFFPELPPDAIAQVSVDLRLGRKFTRFKKPPDYLPSIYVEKSLWKSADLWEHFEQDKYLLEPGEFVLAQTLEAVTIPPDLVGLVEGRSSWARLGITIHVTAPKIDPGFSAPITLEMANFGRVPVSLRAEIDQPAQLMFLRLSKPVEAESLYGMDSQDHFQNQVDPIPYRS